MEKKYKIDYEDSIEYLGVKLYRITALRDFGDIKKGNKGGYVQGYHNLSQAGTCWIYDDARVMHIASVHNNAIVRGRALVKDQAQVSEEAIVDHGAILCEYASAYGNALVLENTMMRDKSIIRDNACAKGNPLLQGYAVIQGTSSIKDSSIISDFVIVENTLVYGHPNLRGNIKISSSSDFMVFKNNWSSGRYFTWTKPDNMWNVGCFRGTGEELIQKAYADSNECGENYRKFVKFVEENFLHKV